MICVSMVLGVFQKWLDSLGWIYLLESHSFAQVNFVTLAFGSLWCYVLMYNSLHVPKYYRNDM